jgi:indole-3-glycerol phosphate synthase
MNTLAEIIEKKKTEVAERKRLYPLALLERSSYFNTPPVSLKRYLTRSDKTGIIAEFKRKSPSKGMINEYAPVERTTIGYMQAGASALSVLTDTSFFGGYNHDLTTARTFNFCPILRKDFIIDEYQVLEAKSIGADAVLLIAAALSAAEIMKLAALSKSIGMEVLMEVHEPADLEKICDEVDIVGVNNRDLKTFAVSLATSQQLAPLIPGSVLKISESGINSPSDVLALRAMGYQGFLMGEVFMKHSRPDMAARKFMDELRRQTKPASV